MPKTISLLAAFADKLTEFGFRVVRVTNADVMHNMEGVLTVISEALREAAKPHPNPVSGEQFPGLFRSCRGHDRPETPEGEGLKEAPKLLGISLEGSVE